MNTRQVSAVVRCLIIGGVLSAAFVLSACQNAPKSEAEASDHAVVCPACETVWVARPTTVGPRNIDRFQYSTEMTCPTCEKMVTAYLQDEKLVLHECPTCKVTPKVYKPRRPMDHTGHKHQ